MNNAPKPSKWIGQPVERLEDPPLVTGRGRFAGDINFARQLHMNDKVDVTLNINGRDHSIHIEPRKTLVDAIRDECGLTGTHIGCEHGFCGACTVIVAGEAVRSCLMFAVQAQGKPIRTVEGLANGATLHPLQRAFMTSSPSRASPHRPTSCIRCRRRSATTTACNAGSALPACPSAAVPGAVRRGRAR